MYQIPVVGFPEKEKTLESLLSTLQTCAGDRVLPKKLDHESFTNKKLDKSTSVGMFLIVYICISREVC